MKRFRIIHTLKSEIVVTLCSNVCGIYFKGQEFVWSLLLIHIFTDETQGLLLRNLTRKKIKLKIYMQQTSMNHTLA